MEPKEYILIFKSGAWQKVICADMKLVISIRDNELERLYFEPCEGSTEPYFIDIREIAGIFPSVKKVKNIDNTQLTDDQLKEELEKFEDIVE